MKNNFLNKSNFNKFLSIFLVGFVSRILVGYFYSVNLYLDFLSPVSILYYISMSAFIVLVHEFVNNFNIIPSFSFINEIYNIFIDMVGFIIRMLISMNKILFSYKLEDIKISSIIKGGKYFFNRNKATIEVNQTLASQENDNGTKILASKSLASCEAEENSYISSKNDDDGSKKRLPQGNWMDARTRRNAEVLMRREQAARIARERLQSGLITQQGNTNTYSSRYESTQLPPITNIAPRINHNLPVLMPYVNNLLLLLLRMLRMLRMLRKIILKVIILLLRVLRKRVIKAIVIILRIIKIELIIALVSN